jgi:hypothetical protein
MSSIEKSTAIVRGPDGKTVYMETTSVNCRARLAFQLMAATMTSDVLKSAISDDGPKRISPRHVASMACDMANAMYQELEQREWIRYEPPPPDAEELGAF